LENGRASVCSITSDRAIVIEDWVYDDPAYIFDLGDGRSLYLRGPEYRPKDDDAPWPARQFEIVRTSPDGLWVGVFTGREPLSQVRRVPMAEMPESYWYSCEPKTEAVLPGRPDEILRWLGHLAA